METNPLSHRDTDPEITRIVKVLILVLTLFSPCTEIMAFDQDPSPTNDKEFRSEAPQFNLGAFLASFYGNYISPVDGRECPSIPTCSSYSAKAFKKHGFIMGWLMTVDRLIHEGRDEAQVSPMISRQGKAKIYDPVENNDFWWFSTDRNPHE